MSSEEGEVVVLHTCVTCGARLHPERAAKYAYCMSPECQEKNARGLAMVAVGVNKAAEQYLLLDDQTKADLAGGRYHDQRRGSFWTSPAAPAAAPAAQEPADSGPQRRKRSERPQPKRPVRKPWSVRQQRLALLYNEQGLRPDEIAAKLGLSSYVVTQIILTSRNPGR